MGEALIYYETPTQRRRFMPDYRGGVSYARGLWEPVGPRARTDASPKAIWMASSSSRFGNDSLLYSQNRAGYTLRSAESRRLTQRARFCGMRTLPPTHSANIGPTMSRPAPGARFRFDNSPVLFSVSRCAARITVNEFNPRRPNYTELRVGVWYAFTR